MAIDPKAVGATTEPMLFEWTDRDTLLYALGVGAGLEDLAFTTENSHDIDQQVLPTYAVICCPAFGAAGKVGSFNWAMLLHGSQGIRLHAPLPAAGKLSVVTEVADIQDKGEGKNAIIMLRGRGTDPDTGTLIAETLTTLVIRGEGGFGGQPGQRPVAPEIPDREPDARVALPTREDQPLIYRLSGDRNPLHSDPWFAKELAGFPKPIMHGLCTYGFSGRALIAELGDGDAERHHRDRRPVHQAGLPRRDADHADLAHRARQSRVPHGSFRRRRQSRRGWCSRTARWNTGPNSVHPVYRGRRRGSPGMAFKLTYSDGQSTDYDDSTNWEVDNGVVKLGRESGEVDGVRLPEPLGNAGTGDRRRHRQATTTKTTTRR